MAVTYSLKRGSFTAG